MLISRGLGLLKASRCHIHAKMPGTHLQLVRSGHGPATYRELPVVPKIYTIAAEFAGAIAWYWIFWHLWHEFHHIVGHYDYPDPSKWSDEELGIPPEDEK